MASFESGPPDQSSTRFVIEAVQESARAFFLATFRRALDVEHPEAGPDWPASEHRRRSAEAFARFPAIAAAPTPRLAAATSRPVVFAVDILIESVGKTHESDLSLFNARWDTLTLKRGSAAVDPPIDIRRFALSVHEALLQAGFPDNPRALVLIALERELMQTVTMFLFESNSRLADALPRTATAAAHDDPSSTHDAILFDALCGILSVWSPDMQDSTPTATAVNEPARPVLAHSDLSAALSSLQRWVPQVIEDAIGGAPGVLAESIKDVLVRKAESLGAPKGQLADDDEKAVALVDTAFTGELMERKLQSATRSILAQMLFPSVKAALLDRQWFSKNEHPARRLLASVTTACHPPSGEPPAADVLRKASETVEKLVSGFNEDVSVFEELAKEMQDFMGARARFNAPAPPPPRQLTDFIDAARAELSARWLNRPTARRTRAFCLDVGPRHLAAMEMDRLRGSAQWVSALNAFDLLIDLRSTEKSPARIDGSLRATLISILAAQGKTGVRAHHTLAELEDAIHQHRVQGVDLPPLFDPDALPADLPDTKLPPPQRQVGDAVTERDLVVGTLWKLVDSHGDTAVIKLSWVSPISSKYLFVNAQGSRKMVASRDEVIDHLRAGRLSPAADGAF